MDRAAASLNWRISFDRTAQIKAGIVTVLFIVLFWNQIGFIPELSFLPASVQSFLGIGSLVRGWTGSADWSHGPLIPIFSAYLVYMRWDQIRRCPIEGTWVGVPVILLSFLLYVYSMTEWGVILLGRAQPYLMLLCLAGVVILLCGLPVMRFAWLPIAYLLFAIPLPKGIYFALTNPLRELAARVATSLLSFVPDLSIERFSSIIEYSYGSTSGMIGVADACSGMRSTITLCALGVAVAFLAERPLWHRVVLVLMCIPIATFCNMIRVVITCWLHIFVDPKYAEGNYHMMLGFAVLLLAFGLFNGVGWILANLFVTVEEDDLDDVPQAAGGRE